MADERLPVRSDGAACGRACDGGRACGDGRACGARGRGRVGEGAVGWCGAGACETEPHYCGARAQKSEEEDGAAAVGVADATPEEAGEQAGDIVRGGKGACREAYVFLGDAVISDHVRHHRHQEGDDDAVRQRYEQQQADRAEREGRRRGLLGYSAHRGPLDGTAALAGRRRNKNLQAKRMHDEGSKPGRYGHGCGNEADSLFPNRHFTELWRP